MVWVCGRTVGAMSSGSTLATIAEGCVMGMSNRVSTVPVSMSQI